MDTDTQKCGWKIAYFFTEKQKRKKTDEKRILCKSTLRTRAKFKINSAIRCRFIQKHPDLCNHGQCTEVCYFCSFDNRQNFYKHNLVWSKNKFVSLYFPIKIQEQMRLKIRENLKTATLNPKFTSFFVFFKCTNRRFELIITHHWTFHSCCHHSLKGKCMHILYQMS